MVTSIPKEKLKEMYVNNTLYGWLMKNHHIKKGDTFSYGNIMGVTIDDLKVHFEERGYPGLNIFRKLIKTEPEGRERETVWTLKDGVYTAWWIERGSPSPEFSTSSKDEFEAWWKEHTIKEYEFKLRYPWKA